VPRTRVSVICNVGRNTRRAQPDNACCREPRGDSNPHTCRGGPLEPPRARGRGRGASGRMWPSLGHAPTPKQAAAAPVFLLRRPSRHHRGAAVIVVRARQDAAQGRAPAAAVFIRLIVTTLMAVTLWGGGGRMGHEQSSPLKNYGSSPRLPGPHTGTEPVAVGHGVEGRGQAARVVRQVARVAKEQQVLVMPRPADLAQALRPYTQTRAQGKQ
jgi:hypothetical protein